MTGPAYRLVCTDCQFEESFPTRETAEHARRVHERRHGHHVALDRVE